MKNKNLKDIILPFSLAANLFAAVVFFTPLTEWLHRPLTVDEPPSKSEAIVILSGDMYRNGTLGLMTLTRLIKGVELYRNKWADKIICIGGKRATLMDNKSIAEAMREKLIIFGIPQEDVLINDKTVGTHNDIDSLILDPDIKFDFNKAIFVTSSFHTFRVKKILQKRKLGAIVISAEPYEQYPIFCTQRPNLFLIVVREYLAICYSRMKGLL